MAATDSSKRAVPRLRFPGFEGDWGSRQLGSEGEFLSSLTGKKGADFGTGNAKYIPYMNVFLNTFVNTSKLGTVRVDPGESQNAIRKGDVLFTVSSETSEEAGMSSVLLEEIPNCYVNSFCAVFRFDDGKAPNPVFTGYLLRQSITRTYFSAKAQGSTRFNLSKGAFRSLPLLIPKEKEQQKIADCLSSIDAWIGAETRKLDALKTHKQGLMQQLFPAEGQRLPHLRFPGFEGWWEEKLLQDIAPLQRGFDLPSSQLRPGKIPVVYSNGVQNFHSTGMVKGPGIVTGRSGTIGKINFVPNDDYWPHNTTLWVTSFCGNEPLYVYYLLNFIGMERFASGSGVPTLNRNDVHSFQIYIPGLREQQKIASCLSSLDDLIAAKSRNISVLQQHKNGLMQGLFPAVDGQSA